MYSSTRGASVRRVRPRRQLGLSIPPFDSIIGGAESAARAQLYQQLADFQKLPQRMQVVQSQLATFGAWSASRSLDESAQLTALQTTLSSLGADWNNANNTVSAAITALSGNDSTLDMAGSVASAIAAMTLAASAVSNLESNTRALISSSGAISDAQKQQLLAMGPAGTFSLGTALLWIGGGYLALKALRIL